MPAVIDMRVAPDARVLTSIVAAELSARIRTILASREFCTLQLCAGRALESIYERLASHYTGVVDWTKVRSAGPWPTVLPAVDASDVGPDLALASVAGDLPAIADVLVVASGEADRAALQAALDRAESHGGRVTWFVDQAARG